MINLTIYGHDGQLYELTDRHSQPQASSAYIFRNDTYLTQRLIARLPIEPSRWLQLLAQIGQRPADVPTQHDNNIYQAVAKAITRGDLVLYKLPLLTSTTSLRGKNNTGLCIIKGPKPHSATALSPAVINSTEGAQALLQELNITDAALLAYLNHHNLHSSHDQQNPINEVLQRLAKGQLLAYKIALPPVSALHKAVEYADATGPAYQPAPLAPESNSPTASESTQNPSSTSAAEDASPQNTQAQKAEKAEADQVEAMQQAADNGTPFCEDCATEEPQNTADTTNKPTQNTSQQTLNSHSSNAQSEAPASAPNSPSPAVEVKKTCSLTTAIAKCSHGGRVSSGGKLEVVPAESGDRITLEATINDNCGSHAEWGIRGPMGYSLKTGIEASFTANSWLLGNADTLFIPHADPQIYEVDIKACSGNKRLTVLSYPNDKLSVKFNGLGKEKNFAEKLDYVVNSLAAFLPKFQFNPPSGSVTFSAQWAEHTDYRAFYRYQISGGFNPVIGATLRVPFGPTAAIPPWIKEYGDFYLFVEFTGGVSINLNFEKLTPDTHTAYVEAKGSIEGKIGASLFLMNDSVLKAEAFGSTGISFKGWTDKELDNPKLFGQFEWEGLKGSLSVQVGWGWVEFNREWTVVDGGPLHKEPMITNLKDWVD